MKLFNNLGGGGILEMLGVQMYVTYNPSSCASQVPDHQCSDCETPEHGRIRAVAFISKDFIFSDPTNPTQWQTGITNKKIIIIPATHGTFDGGSEILGIGYGSAVSKLTGYNFKVTYFDPGYKNNADFYNAIKFSQNYYFAYVTETQVHIVVPVVQVIPKNPVTDSLTDEVAWQVDVIWTDSNLPVPYNVPAVFTCFAYTT